MGDLIGFEGHLNTTTPFSEKEYPTQWKTERQYVDFHIGQNYNTTCDYPRFWFEDGYPVNVSMTSELVGCYNSDFDQYGDIEAFGVFPDWQRQLAKFASVQDRLREWNPIVREKLIRHSCMIIHSLDIDGFRYDKATQATVEALGDMSSAYRECARAVGKENFFIAGEITGGNTFGSIYLGRGRQPNQYPEDAVKAMKLTNESSSQYFLRDIGHEAIDGAAFHYSTYRALTRFLGLDGQLSAGYDVRINWVDAWNEMLQTNDLINPNTGKFDPRHMFGVTNQDVFRWPAIEKGVERQLLGSFITTLLIPVFHYYFGARSKLSMSWTPPHQTISMVDSRCPLQLLGELTDASPWIHRSTISGLSRAARRVATMMRLPTTTVILPTRSTTS